MLVASELAALIGAGVVAGTLLGGWVSKLFIRICRWDRPGARAAFLVTIAWPVILRIYLLLALMFLVTLTLLAILLMRMRIFQAVKLGETT